MFDFLSHHGRILFEWADRAEIAIAEWPTQSADARRRAALERIRGTLAGYPPAPSPAAADA